jgi:hypothetical protein
VRLGTERVGPRGFALLGATGLMGLVLAVHGYGHGTVVAGGLTSVAAPAKSTKARAASARSSSTSTTSTTPASSSKSSASNQKLGPLLSSTQYASYAYQLYPGQEGSQARLATAGFDIRITPGPGAFTVSVSATGSTQGAQNSTHPANDHVYFIEASFGDDSGNSEYNYGDDGVVVTNASGRIVE